MKKQNRGRRGGLLVAAVLGVTLGTGCEVVNPGPVEDEYMTLPASQQGFVNGAMERLMRAVGQLSYTTALVAREIFPGGQTGSYGHSIINQAGNHAWNSAPQYNTAQQARWVAEEAVRQFNERGDVAPVMLAQAYVWAGYANRVLGENWCEAVIDGGPLVEGITYFERAEQHFTDAIAVAPQGTEWRDAAIAGRAQVRMWLDDWAGAASDAQQIPTDFEFMLEQDFTSGGNTAQRNHIYWAAASTPYRSYTVRFTYYDDYYAETGDPRTPWAEYEAEANRLCAGSLPGYGRVPCTQQMKYTSQDDDIRLASGREMRLIEAEALLVEGNWQAALERINSIRTTVRSDHTGQFLAPWTASNLEEAWTVLKRERGIELWLEGRRMGDQRRWEPILGEPVTPGDLELPDFEAQSTVFIENPRGRPLIDGQEHPRALCFNISNTERNTNPNIEEVDG